MEALPLGVGQGVVLMFVPVSSTGRLVIVQHALRSRVGAAAAGVGFLSP